MKRTLLIVLSAVLLLCSIFAVSILLIDMVGSSDTPETSGSSADVLSETLSPETSEIFSEITTEITTEYIVDTVSPTTSEEVTSEISEIIDNKTETTAAPSYINTSPYQEFFDVADANKYDAWYKNEMWNAITQLEMQMARDCYHKFWEEELAFTLKIAKPLFRDTEEYESWKFSVECWLENEREIARIEGSKFISAYQRTELLACFTDSVRQKVIDTKYFLYLLEAEEITIYKDPYIGITWNEEAIIKSVTSESIGVDPIGSQGMAFEIEIENGKSYAILTGGGTCTDTDIVVPAYYLNSPVTQIGEKAFYGQEQITSVILPDTVRVIDQYAFGGCRSLARIKLSNNLYSIQASAFEGCRSLKTIDIPGGVKYLYEYCFAYCSSLKSIKLPNDLQTIYRDVFRKCTSLDEITLPASVQNIYQFAFADCSNLEIFRYEGTVAEWREVSKDGGWRPGAPFTQVVCADGVGHIANTELDASDFADLPEVYRAVLNNEKTFIYAIGEKTVMLLDDYIFPYLNESILSCSVKYAKVDMDGDGEAEVLLEGSCGDVLVLHHENGVVYGYDFLFRYMNNVKTDGTFLWSYTGNKHSYGVNKLTFSGDDYTLIDVCYVEEEGEDKITYFIGEKSVSKSEYDAFYSALSQEEVVWTDIDRYPVEQKHPPM